MLDYYQTVTEDELSWSQRFHLVNSNEPGYEWYKDRVEKAVPGTCQWFLGHPNFKNWLADNSGLLLVSADPGYGKSVLAKFLVDDYFPGLMQSRSMGQSVVGYFFFKDQIQSKLSQALCALLHQLFLEEPGLIRYAMPYTKEHGEELMYLPEKLWAILQNVLRDEQAGRIILVIDALDECDDTNRNIFVGYVGRYFKTVAKDIGNVRMLIIKSPI